MFYSYVLSRDYRVLVTDYEGLVSSAEDVGDRVVKLTNPCNSRRPYLVFRRDYDRVIERLEGCETVAAFLLRCDSRRIGDDYIFAHCLESRSNVNWAFGDGNIVYATTGELVPLFEKVVEIEEEYYTADDLPGHFDFCLVCNSFENSDYTRRALDSYGNDIAVCESCVDNGEVWYCDDCDEYYTEECECHYLERYDRNVCDHCLENYHWCDHCESYVCEDDWDYDDGCCVDCVESDTDPDAWGAGEDIIEDEALTDQQIIQKDIADGLRGAPRRYDSSRKYEMPMYGEDDEIIEDGALKHNYIGLGTELECDRGTNKETLLGWLEKHVKGASYSNDGSLSSAGFEMVTCPKTYENWKAMPWEKIMNHILAYGYKSHDTSTCGLHVHVSRTAFLPDGEDYNSFSDLRDKTNDNVGKLSAFFSYYNEDIVKLSRRREMGWCQLVQPYYSKDDALYLESIQTSVKGMISHGERYYAVNNTNKTTVEIRLFKGTLNVDSFRACVDFAYRVCLNAKDVTDFRDVKQWLRGIEPKTLEYLHNRGAFVDVKEVA